MCCPFVVSSSPTVGRESWLLVLRASGSHITSGVPQGSVFCPLLFILYTCDMFELVENRLFAYADESTLLAVVRKPADRPGVAYALNRDLVRIRGWYNHWCMILIANHNKTKALVLSRSRTVSDLHVDIRSRLRFLFDL